MCWFHVVSHIITIDVLGTAPNGTSVDIVLIVLDDENATTAPSMAATTMMPTSVSSSMDTSVSSSMETNTMDNATEAPSSIMATTPTPSMRMTTASPSAPTPANIVLNLEPNTTTEETPTIAPFPTVAIPPQAPQSPRPVTDAPIVSDFPSSGPTLFPTTGSPTMDMAACSLHNQCANLTGDCCPTIDNVDLACCGVAAVEETCELNVKCVDEWGLAGSCCPTLTGVYLDCCDAVPDDCLDGGNCTVLSTREYVESSAWMTGGSAIMAVLVSMLVVA